MSPEARDLGEPLTTAWVGHEQNRVILDRRGNTLLKEDLAIVARRANALEGCPDPEQFVRDARDLLDAIHKGGGALPGEVDAEGLAWLREDSK